jgi:hypothetical protein
LKIKVTFSLSLINEALCHANISGSGGIAPPFLTLALDRGEWSVPHPGHFTLEKQSLVSRGKEDNCIEDTC